MFDAATDERLLCDEAPRVAASEGVGLSLLERAIVAAARHDPLSSLTPRSGWRQRFDHLAGRRDFSPPLANPGLEAFRRAAVHAWHGHAALSDHDRSELADAGYPGSIYDVLRDAIGPDHRVDAAAR